MKRLRLSSLILLSLAGENFAFLLHHGPAQLRCGTADRPSLLHAHSEKQNEDRPRSRILSIRSKNLGGARGDTKDDGNILVPLVGNVEASSGPLVAVTGETGSGKSLLVSKALDLIAGGKVQKSLVSQQLINDNSVQSETFVEIEVELLDPHLPLFLSTLQQVGLDPDLYLARDDLLKARICLKRNIVVHPRNDNQQRQQISSGCFLNGKKISLKTLRHIAAPLITIVDAPKASSALAKPAARMAMIDAAVPADVLAWTKASHKKYHDARKYRESLETDVANRALPRSMVQSRDDEDLQLLTHWVDELDGFEGRIVDFCARLSSGVSDDVPSSQLAILLQELASSSWMENDDAELNGSGSSDSFSFSSSIYRLLQDVVDEARKLDDQISSAKKAVESLHSLSAQASARLSIQTAREYLFEASDSRSGGRNGMNNRVHESAEKAHDLLNTVEDKLGDVVRHLDDDDKGLVALLRAEQRKCAVSQEDVQEILAEWNTMARKHGVSASLLPSCHASLRQELDGSVEAKQRLPLAKDEEAKALSDLTEACKALSMARTTVCENISRAVTRRLPSLGLTGSTFDIRLDPTHRDYTSSSAVLGTDAVDFFLVHDGSDERNPGGRLEQMASAGEKARIMLAMECEIPGTISALCGSSTGGAEASNQEGISRTASVPPVVVVYDEIDAHVGGRAAVAVADMLSDQSQSCQVLCITHSPSVAAVADLHLVVNKLETKSQIGSGIAMDASIVSGAKRRKELARMASGDAAVEEAEVFAEALIREGSTRKQKAT